METMDDVLSAAAERLSVLNGELSNGAEVRYVWLQPGFDDDAHLVTVWKLEEPGDDGWDLDYLDELCQMARECLAGLAETQCLFRTAAELEEASQQIGHRVPEPV